MRNMQLSATVIWVLLMLATAVSWWLGGSTGSARSLDAPYTTAGILLMAGLKVRFVILDFMEVRDAPPGLRLSLEAWLLLVVGALLALYWNASA